MHRKRGIDPGTEVTEWSGAPEGIPRGSGVPPPPVKLQRTSSTIVLPLIFGIWFGVFPIGRPILPVGLGHIQLQSATRRPDCAWTVGIASVGTESVGIVWCTRVYIPQKSVQVNFLWGRNDVRTAIEHEYLSFFYLPKNFYTPKQITGYAADLKV